MGQRAWVLRSHLGPTSQKKKKKRRISTLPRTFTNASNRPSLSTTVCSPTALSSYSRYLRKRTVSSTRYLTRVHCFTPSAPPLTPTVYDTSYHNAGWPYRSGHHRSEEEKRKRNRRIVRTLVFTAVANAAISTPPPPAPLLKYNKTRIPPP